MATGGGSAFYNYESFKDISTALIAKKAGNIEETGGYKEFFFKEPTYYR